MTARHRRRIHKRALGAILVLLGILVWVIAATLPLTPLHWLGPVGLIEQLSLEVVAGGALVAAGIMLLAISASHRARGPAKLSDRAARRSRPAAMR
jgi:hypothetical protein